MGKGLKRDAETEAAARAFGVAVRRARQQLELTQNDLARIIGGTQPSVRQVELTGATPKGKYFFILCEELGLDPLAYGFTGEGRAIIEEWLEYHGKN